METFLQPSQSNNPTRGPLAGYSFAVQAQALRDGGWVLPTLITDNVSTSDHQVLLGKLDAVLSGPQQINHQELVRVQKLAAFAQTYCEKFPGPVKMVEVMLELQRSDRLSLLNFHVSHSLLGPEKLSNVALSAHADIFHSGTVLSSSLIDTVAACKDCPYLPHRSHCIAMEPGHTLRFEPDFFDTHVVNFSEAGICNFYNRTSIGRTGFLDVMKNEDKLPYEDKMLVFFSRRSQRDSHIDLKDYHEFSSFRPRTEGESVLHYQAAFCRDPGTGEY